MASMYFILSSILVFSLSKCSGSGTPSQDELQIILDFKVSLGITNSTRGFESWTQANAICTFKGIICDNNGSITNIDLTNTGISGTVPFGSLCQLSSLSLLFLGSNNLSGVLNDIQECNNLSHLDLASNLFSGVVPDFSPLNKLQFLNISGNKFIGPFPWNSLANLTNLRVLSLGDNSFDRTYSFPEVVVNLTKLKWLYMSNCNIGGEIPQAIGNLAELIHLEVSDNFLSGEIPQGITSLKNLNELELYNNSLTGKLPVGFSNLSSLSKLDISMNRLQGDLSELRGSVNLASLQLFENNLTGELPREFGEFQKLVNLSLYTNGLSGQLPENLGSWAEFNFIDVSTNSFTGEIPRYMCKKGTMQKLLVLENSFSGQIPAEYENCSTLTRFRVSNNLLSGNVPAGLWGLPNMELLDLAENQLEGSIGAEIAGAKSLSQLFLAGNLFSGEIPAEIGLVKPLVTIDITGNNLSGEIPVTVGELSNLNRLQLAGNRLSGEIPTSIGSCGALSQLNLSGNELSGLIPASLGQLTRLNLLDLSDNELTGKIPSSLGLRTLSVLNLSDNELTGPIPGVLSIAVYSKSFLGNAGLCVEKNYNNFQSVKQCSSSLGRSSSNRHTIIAWSVSSSLLLLVVILAFILVKRQYAYPESRLRKGPTWNLKSFRVLNFDEQDIINSIRPQNLIGKGGSGDVYRVQLRSGEVMAVKHIWNDPLNPGKELSTHAILGRRGRSATKEFEAEVATLSAISHVNVVKLYCSVTSEEWSLLVYEYLPNGNLWERLHTVEGNKSGGLQWETRYKIALGAAKGLEYLHHGCDRPILHRDVKSSNILLDKMFKPRIADFGLAKLLQSGGGGKDSTAPVIAGTHGYIAPEYAYTWKVTEKSDVYSFGVVLMELVTGRRPIDVKYGEDKDIVDWVRKSFKGKDSVVALVDNSIAEWARDEAVKVLKIAVHCTARLPRMRPAMREVVLMLEEVPGDGRVVPVAVRHCKLDNNLLKL